MSFKNNELLVKFTKESSKVRFVKASDFRALQVDTDINHIQAQIEIIIVNIIPITAHKSVQGSEK